MKRSKRLLQHPICTEGVAGASLSRLSVIRGGVQQTPRPFRTGRFAQNDHHLLFFIRSGQYLLLLDGVTSTVSAGSVIVVPATCVRQIDLTSKRGEHVFIHTARNAQLDRLFGTHGSVVECNNVDEFFDAAIKHSRHASGTTPDSLSIAEHYGAILAVFIRRILGRSTTNPLQQTHLSRFEMLWQAIQEAPAANWNIPQMAKQVNLSEPHFYALCRELTGMSPGRHLTRIRMEQAKLLLKSTDFTLDQISNMTGYRTGYSFSRAFTEYTGIRPGKYRKE